MDNFIQATPFFSVRSIEDAVAFYRDRLGFAVFVQMNGYAYLGRGRAGIRLLTYTPDDGPFAAGSAYVDVDDVARSSASIVPAGPIFPTSRSVVRSTKATISAKCSSATRTGI